MVLVKLHVIRSDFLNSDCAFIQNFSKMLEYWYIFTGIIHNTFNFKNIYFIMLVLRVNIFKYRTNLSFTGDRASSTWDSSQGTFSITTHNCRHSYTLATERSGFIIHITSRHEQGSFSVSDKTHYRKLSPSVLPVAMGVKCLYGCGHGGAAVVLPGFAISW